MQAAAGYEVPPDASLSGSYLAGRSASKLRDNDVASGYFARALRDDPGNPVLVERLFLLELSEGNLSTAEDHALRVLSFNSQQRMARIVLGLKDYRLRRYEAARKHFAEAAYTPVGELTSALLIAWSWAGEGELNPALNALDKLDANESFANLRPFTPPSSPAISAMPCVPRPSTRRPSSRRPRRCASFRPMAIFSPAAAAPGRPARSMTASRGRRAQSADRRGRAG
jgi:tetratricopeptide (TPR) repeat protein